MRDQSSQWVAWSTMCWRISQSKISAPPPVSDSRPASISSSRISWGGQAGDLLEPVDLGRGERLEADPRQRRLQLPQDPRVVLPRQGRVQAVDDVQLGELLALHLLGLGDGLVTRIVYASFSPGLRWNEQYAQEARRRWSGSGAG